MSNESLSEVHSTVPTNHRGFKRILAFLGPAYLISVGYMDPGNWATDIAGGSAFGYKLIWVLLMSNLIAVLLQTLSVRLGIVGGMDLAQASKKSYPKWVNLPLWGFAEIAIAATDLAEIIGMAIGLNLLFDLPLVWGVVITAVDSFFLLFLLNKGMRIMEVFIISMVSIIGLSFLVEMFIVGPRIAEVATGFIPSSLTGNALYIAIGIIGATVMPHNLYLHSSLVQTRKIERSETGIRRALKLNFFDTTIALNLAFLVNAAILILAAAAFHRNGYFDVAEIQDASKLLEDLFGNLAPTLFAIALIAAGQSSTITGTLAGQIVMEGHLNLRIQPWIRRLITRLIAITPAIFTILYFGENALGSLLIFSQVILSLQLGFAVIPLIHFTSNRGLMKDFTIKTWVKIFAWVSAGIIVYLNISLVIDEISGWLSASSDNQIYVYTLVIPFALLSLGLLIYVSIHPFFSKIQLTESSPLSSDDQLIPHGMAEKDIDFSNLEKTSYQHIAVALDFFGNEQQIIKQAIRLGDKETEYTFIHVVESAAARYLGKNTMDFETQVDYKNLKKYQTSLQELGYKVNLKIGFGKPSNEIVKMISASDFDLFVLGVHGHSGIEDIIFGTTLGAIRHNTEIPIHIVR